MKPIKRIGQPKIINTNFDQELEKIIENIDNKIDFKLNLLTFSKFCYALDSAQSGLDERDILYFKSQLLGSLSHDELKEFAVDLTKEDYSAEVDLSILKFMLANLGIINEYESENLIDSYKVINKLTE